jgi:hypothetical protein
VVPRSFKVRELADTAVALANTVLLGTSSVMIHDVTQAEVRDYKCTLHKLSVLFAVAKGAA